MALWKDRAYFYDSSCFWGRARPRNWFVYLAAWILRPLAKLVYRYKVVDAANLPEPGRPVVYAVNHVSFADPIALWFALYPHGGTRFLARSSLFRPVAGGAIARAGGIPIDPDSPDRTALKRAAAALKRGESVTIFPEGTRMNRPDKPYRPHAGLVLIANMGKAPIVPIGCSGTERIKPPGQKLVHFPRVYYKVGAAIDPKDAKYAALDKKERTARIVDDVMAQVFALRDTARCPQLAAGEGGAGESLDGGFDGGAGEGGAAAPARPSAGEEDARERAQSLRPSAGEGLAAGEGGGPDGA